MPPFRRVETGRAFLSGESGRTGGQARNRFAGSTGKTIASVARLEADMERTRRRGHAVDRGDFRQRDDSLGSGNMLPNGETNGAPGVSAPDIKFGIGGVERIDARVRLATCAVSNRLRWQAASALTGRHRPCGTRVARQAGLQPFCRAVLLSAPLSWPLSSIRSTGPSF